MVGQVPLDGSPISPAWRLRHRRLAFGLAAGSPSDSRCALLQPPAPAGSPAARAARQASGLQRAAIAPAAACASGGPVDLGVAFGADLVSDDVLDRRVEPAATILPRCAPRRRRLRGRPWLRATGPPTKMPISVQLRARPSNGSEKSLSVERHGPPRPPAPRVALARPPEHRGAGVRAQRRGRLPDSTPGGASPAIRHRLVHHIAGRPAVRLGLQQAVRCRGNHMPPSPATPMLQFHGSQSSPGIVGGARQLTNSRKIGYD